MEIPPTRQHQGCKKLFETSFEEQFNNHKTLSSHLNEVMFPEGIIYNRETKQLRTKRVNSIFASIPQFTRVLDNQTKREITFYSDFPSQVALSGEMSSFLAEDIQRILESKIDF